MRTIKLLNLGIKSGISVRRFEKRWKGVHYSDDEIEEIANKIIDYVDDAINNKECPILAGFCAKNRMSKNVIYSWEGKHDCIDEAVSYLEDYKEHSLVQSGLGKEWDSATTRLMLSSHHGYTDRNTLQGDAANPLGINHKHDPAKAAEEIIAAHGASSVGKTDES